MPQESRGEAGDHRIGENRKDEAATSKPSAPG
jgi:hypothetical protein